MSRIISSKFIGLVRMIGRGLKSMRPTNCSKWPQSWTKQTMLEMLEQTMKIKQNNKIVHEDWLSQEINLFWWLKFSLHPHSLSFHFTFIANTLSHQLQSQYCNTTCYQTHYFTLFLPLYTNPNQHTTCKERFKHFLLFSSPKEIKR